MKENIKQYCIKSLFQVIYHVTFKCNAKCSFCFNWKDINQNSDRELSLAEAEKISRSMPEFSWLMLSGGEPLLREDLVGIIGIFYHNNKIKHLTLPTNGLLSARIYSVAEELLERYPDLTVTVSFSLDGLGDDHDGPRGVKGCYRKLLESYRGLAPLRGRDRLSVKFNSVVGNFNCRKIDELISKVRDLKPDMHTIDFVRGSLKDGSIGLPGEEDLDKIIKKIARNYQYYQGYSNIKKHSKILQRVSYIVQQEYLDFFKESLRTDRQVIPCLAHKRSLVIYPYGDISFCEPLPPFANFRDYNYSYKEAVNSSAAKKQAEVIINNKCHCYHPCFQYLNILFSPGRMIKGAVKNAF